MSSSRLVLFASLLFFAGVTCAQDVAFRNHVQKAMGIDMQQLPTNIQIEYQRVVRLKGLDDDDNARDVLSLDKAALVIISSKDGTEVMRQGYDGTQTWPAYDMMGEKRRLPPKIMIIGWLANPLVMFSRTELTFTQLPDQQEEGKTYHVAHVTHAQHAFVQMEVWVDPKTWLPVKLIQKNRPEFETFSDYRRVDGLQYPFRIEEKSPSGSIVKKITALTLNPDVPDHIFLEPKSE